MIVQDIYLKDYDWHCKVYYAVDDYYVDEIINELELIGANKYDLDKMSKSLFAGKYNTGFTYSNIIDRESVIVIGITTCPAEFQNTYDHEKGHLIMHISQALNIDPYSEDYQYLAGEVGKLTFPVAKRFLCEHCRSELKSSFKNK